MEAVRESANELAAMSVETTLRQFLCEAHRRVSSDAVAFISPSRDQFQVHGGAADDSRSIREKFEMTADTFLLEVRNRRDPLVRNRVRYQPGGPLLGRFLIIPIFADAGQLRGILSILRAPEAAAFTAEDGRLGMQLCHQLSKVMSLPADPVTGLLTRTSVERLVELRQRSLEERASSSVLYADIDQLHIVNDLLGFEAGDQAIAAVAAALNAELTGCDAVLSRLSGDRFTVFLPGSSLPEARKIASRLRGAVEAASVANAGEMIPLSISIGAAALRAGERSFDHALAAAEVACKAAKDRGRNRVEIYQISDSSIIRRRDDVAIVGRLRSALDAGRFRIFGQPIAALLQPEESRRYEMLLRIIDEKDRLVLPGSFMSSATRYQLLPQIDRCVVSYVLQQLKAARSRAGFEPLHVSLNLSGPTISDPSFHEWLLAELDAAAVPGDWVTFELTEAAAVNNLELAQLLMNRLGERGCRFALDDFGTGVSSLAHLKEMHFSTLKIDGSFVRDILHNERSQSLVRAISELAHAMGMETVAEYVETPEICMRLIELQVQFGQGYAIGRPRPLEGILDSSKELARAS
jgi:diguanylate cyclase (GGDEF)-like protein